MYIYKNYFCEVILSVKVFKVNFKFGYKIFLNIIFIYENNLWN